MAASDVPESFLRWAARAVGPDSTVSAVEELRAGRGPWLLHIETGDRDTCAVLKAGRDVLPEIRTEVAALLVAEKHDLPTPRVMAADLTGESSGGPAVLMTLLQGSSPVPLEANPGRLRALGAAAAAFHRVAGPPSADLPLRQRHMPWIDFACERREGAAATTPLLDAADSSLANAGALHYETVFVHGDLWSGNTLWLDDAYVGTIDWEAAGVGIYGVDLGSLRLDAALMYGQDAAEHITVGWKQSSGLDPEDLSLWDIVAALNTPADLDALVATLPDAGRADLDGRTLTTRRDVFLEAALEHHRQC